MMQNLSCSTRCDIGSPVGADEDSPYSCWPVCTELLRNFAGEGETNEREEMKCEMACGTANLPYSQDTYNM